MAQLRANIALGADPETQAWKEEFRGKVMEFVETQFRNFIGEPVAEASRVMDLPLKTGEVTELGTPIGGLFRSEPEGKGPTPFGVMEATGLGVLGGAPGGGTGPANIMRRDLLKSLRATKRRKDYIDTRHGQDPGTSFSKDQYNALVRAVEKTPQKELDRVEEVFVGELGRNLKGAYYPPSGKVGIDPRYSARGIEDTFFHELGHARQIPSEASLKSFPGGEVSRQGARYRRGREGLAEQVISEIDTQGMRLAKTAFAPSKEFYWQNPREVLAREHARNIKDIITIGEPIPDKLYDQAYRMALSSTIDYVVSKAPKTAKFGLEQAKKKGFK